MVPNKITKKMPSNFGTMGALAISKLLQHGKGVNGSSVSGKDMSVSPSKQTNGILQPRLPLSTPTDLLIKNVGGSPTSKAEHSPQASPTPLNKHQSSSNILSFGKHPLLQYRGSSRQIYQTISPMNQ